MENYGETIVIPFLRKKIADLQAAMVVLEANFLIEQGRNKEIANEMAEKNKSIADNSAAQDACIASSKREMAELLTKLNQSLDLNNTLTKRIEDLKRVIAGQENTIIDLQDLNKRMQIEIENSANNANLNGKKKKQKDLVLDGNTF
jgi:membrane-bound ClpP family serine protease